MQLQQQKGETGPPAPGCLFLHTALTNQQIESIDLTDPSVVDLLIEYIQTLPVSEESLGVLRILARAYGIPVIVWMKGWYQRALAVQGFAQANAGGFMKLAAITTNWLEDQSLEYLQFVYQLGQPPNKPRSLPKLQIDLQFVKLLKCLEDRNKLLRSCCQQSQYRKLVNEYQEFITHIWQNCVGEFDLIMLKALDLFILAQAQLDQLGLRGCFGGGLEGGIEGIEGAGDGNQSLFLNQTMLAELGNLNFQKQEQTRLQPIQLIDQQTSKITSINQSSRCQNNASIAGSPLIINKSAPPKEQMRNLQVQTQSLAQDEQGKALCCRRYFQSEEVIKEGESDRRGYLFAPFPFRKDKMEEMKKVICSFLNCEGGNLYIGIVLENNRWVVAGHELTEADKEQVLVSFRQMCGSIEPNIQTNKVYHIDFVPVRNPHGFIPGLNVIKVVVQCGGRDQIYSYREGASGTGVAKEVFPFRLGAQIVVKNGRPLLREMNFRLTCQRGLPSPMHEGPCERPHPGEPLNQIPKQQKHRASRLQSGQLYLTAKSTREKVQEHYQSHRAHHSPAKGLLHQEKQSQLKTRISAFSTKQEKVEKEKQTKWRYFYGTGVTRKQLMPIFQKKQLEAHIKMEQSEEEGLIIKVGDEESSKTVRRLCDKLETKYQERRVKFYELSLVIKLHGVAVNQIKMTNMDHHKLAEENCIKFAYFKDSLKVFLQLRKKNVKVDFVCPPH